LAGLLLAFPKSSLEKKAIAAVFLPRRTLGNFIPFVSGEHLIANSEGEKNSEEKKGENKKGSGNAGGRACVAAIASV